MELMQNSSKFDYFISNDVVLELMNGPRNFNFLKLVKGKILNAEGSLDHNSKFKSFIIEKNGRLSAIPLYGISAEDYNQILLCQNHAELILISNDIKLIKDATVILDKRIKGVPNLIDLIEKEEKYSPEAGILKKFIDVNRKRIGDFDLKNLNN
jgi:hypothetical protein